MSSNIVYSHVQRAAHYVEQVAEQSIRIAAELRELALLKPYAAKARSSHGRLRAEAPDQHRTCFVRDFDRILYCFAFKLLPHKTQVFAHGLLSLMEEQKVHHRDLHTLKVVQIARDICRALGLNEDLAEAIALAHDLGHPPFGHEAEKVLNELSLKYLGQEFKHNRQSLRIIKDLEQLYLSIETMDGVVCHNGEQKDSILWPAPRSRGDLTFDDSRMPMTLEGCVVRLADRIAYLPMDLQDGLMLGLIQYGDIPLEITSVLGASPDAMINTLVQDVIVNSAGKRYITMSWPIQQAMDRLFDFNYQHIYFSSMNVEFRATIKDCIETLYHHFLLQLNHDHQAVIDKIVSLTDQQAMELYRQLKPQASPLSPR